MKFKNIVIKDHCCKCFYNDSKSENGLIQTPVTISDHLLLAELGFTVFNSEIGNTFRDLRYHQTYKVPVTSYK